MNAAAPTSTQRNAATGYWGRHLCRRKVGNAVFQLHEANAPPEAVTEHGHTHAHIVFVTGGAYVTSVTGENSFVATPVAVLNPPGIWHRDHFVGGTGRFMTVDLAHDGLAEDYASHDQSHAVLRGLTRLAAKLHSADDLQLEEDAATLGGCFEETRREDHPSPSSIARAYQAIMDSAQPWALTMNDLASIADVHPNSLPRAFRTQYGRPASQIAKARRVELCSMAMARGTASLADLAVEFGFYDQAHLTNAFRRITGLSPAHWRAEIAK